MNKPGFFLSGAPKCGTTALSEYLRQHPEICVSTPKEPHYFCTDFSDRFRIVHSEDEYLSQCFGNYEPEHHRIRVDASGGYLFSEVAIPNILRFNPDAKLIVMVRNPVEVAYALHSTHLITVYETIKDFETAWDMQSVRAEGKEIPEYCMEPRFLQYASVAKLGAQIERLFGWVPESQRMVIVFDDFVADTPAVYARVLEFLGVDTQFQPEFAKVNENAKFVNAWLHKFTYFPPGALMNLVTGAKRLLGVEKLGILPAIRKLNTRLAKRQPLSPAMKARMIAEFSEDIDLLGRLLNRDLSHWKT